LYNTSRKSDYNARTGCLRRYNRLAFHHNRELQQQLDELQKKYPNTKIMYGDYFKAAMQFVVNPGKFGEFSLFNSMLCYSSTFGGFRVSDHIYIIKTYWDVIDMFNMVRLKRSISCNLQGCIYGSDLCTMISEHFDLLQVSAQLCKLAAEQEGRATTTST
jgi:hypothetical protein